MRRVFLARYDALIWKAMNERRLELSTPRCISKDLKEKFIMDLKGFTVVRNACQSLCI